MLDDKMMRMLNQEISTMESMHHPNLIRLYEVMETYSKLFLVMEYASGGELYNKVTTMGKFEEVVARNLFAQICSAVSHMVSEINRYPFPFQSLGWYVIRIMTICREHGTALGKVEFM